MIAYPAGDLTEMIGKYVMEEIPGLQLEPGEYTAMMVVDDQMDFVAGVVFSNFRGTDIEVSCASSTPAAWRPEVCKAIFTYVFEQLGCVRCTSITTRSHKRARGFLERLGFQLEGNLRLGYDGVRDALIYGLIRSECRFLDRGDNGEEEQSEGPGSTGPGSDGTGAGAAEYRVSDSAGEPQPH